MKTPHVGDIVGDYRVIGIAGAGGMGTVFKIEHLISRRIEAMKLLPAGLSAEPEQVQRFEREIQLQARLHHPNIVELYNAVRDGDSIALIMEFVEGDSLQRLLATGPLPVDVAVGFAIQVLQALAYAHDAGIIHRDVSPANVIITQDGVAKLSDFGLALGIADLRLSTTGVALGSPWYMSPEQVRGLEDPDARTDLYALGAVLHEMLTGRKLFEVEGAFAVMRAQVEAVPQPPSTMNPLVPPSLDTIVSKALAKDPAQRFQSADEFRAALRPDTVNARTTAEPRKTRFAGISGALSALPSSLGGFHVPRPAALLMVPAVLTAGFCAVRYFPSPKHGHSTQNQPVIGATSGHDADRPSPAVTAQTNPVAPAVDPPTPASEPPAVAATVTAPPIAKSPARVTRSAVHSQPDTALRITGAESRPATPIPLSRRDSAQFLEPVDPPKSDAPAASEAEPSEPFTPGTPSLPAAALPETPPTSAPNVGSRLVRALGRVNPLRLVKKNDAAKSELKQH